MKTAKTEPTFLEVSCPYCGQGILGPRSNSYNWDRQDAAKAIAEGVYCLSCNEVSKPNTALRRLAS